MTHDTGSRPLASSIRSLGFLTDLVFHRFSGEVLERGHYIAVRTPSEPAYRWGNLLFFPAAPAAGDLEIWEDAFVREFADLPGVRHRTFSWDTTEGELGQVAPFVECGYEVDLTELMTTRRVRPPARLDASLVCRPLESDRDWASAATAAAAAIEEGAFRSEILAFVERRMAEARAMAAAGLGREWGAFDGDRVVGSLGLFFGDGRGRFRSVTTHPDHRRRGVGSTLVFRATSEALDRRRAHTLVLEVEPDGPAQGVYESLGFAVRERNAGVCRPPG